MIPATAYYFDFRLAPDRYVRDRPAGCVRSEMLEIARDAGAAGDESPANWAGLLVEHGYLSHARGQECASSCQRKSAYF